MKKSYIRKSSQLSWKNLFSKPKKCSFLCLFLALPVFSIRAEEPYQKIEDKNTLQILNPTLQVRKTSKIRLENGLEVLLISDPKADQSAAALAVEAGSWQDPKEYPGTAHFLEHMLFLGTKKYPAEDEYMQFIINRGGLFNAYTAPDRTVYMFSINNENFAQALDRFSHFFIDPLFNPSGVSRELHAVDQENDKNIEHDGWREWMIFKETGNASHPNHLFSTGNKKTLGQIPVEVLRSWYEKHYSADRMHLVVYSTMEIDQLEKLVAFEFSSVPRRQTPKQDYNEPLSSDKQKGAVFYIKPIKDIRKMSFVWEFSKEFANEENKTGEFLAYILKSKADNSLFQQLKKEELAEDLDAEFENVGKNEAFFRLEIALTKNGVFQADKVMERVFQTLSYLKNSAISSELFDEMKTLAKIRYEYQSRQDAFQYVLGQAHSLIDEDLETYPQKTVLPAAFSQEKTYRFLQSLTAEDCMFIVMASPSLTGIEPEHKEKWLGGEYAVKKLSEEALQQLEAASPHAAIGLPKTNPFVPRDLKIENSHTAKEPKFAPKLLGDEQVGKVYFLQDAYYKTPEVALFFNIKSPYFDGSAKSTALMDLYLLSVKENLSSLAYYAETAGLNYDFSLNDLNLSVNIYGYSDKANIFALEVFQALKETIPTHKQFKIYKERLASTYENRLKTLPFFQANEVLSSVLFNDAPKSTALLENLQQIDYEEFMYFTEKLLKQVYVEGTIAGNYSAKQAEALWAGLKETLASTPYPVEHHLKKEVLILPPQGGPYKIIEKTPRQGIAVNLLIQEGPFSFEKLASSQVLGKALQQPFFTTLRTKQQTAYIAKSGPKLVENQLMQYFSVHSSTHQGEELLARFELFLEDYAKDIESQISKEDFESIRSNLIEKLQVPSTNLAVFSQKLHQLAYTFQEDFDFYDKEIKALKNLTYEQFCRDAKSFLSRSNRARIAVIVEGQLHPEKDFKYHITQPSQIKEIGTYVSNR